jgi:hypothetical protein
MGKKTTATKLRPDEMILYRRDYFERGHTDTEIKILTTLTDVAHAIDEDVLHQINNGGAENQYYIQLPNGRYFTPDKERVGYLNFTP